MGRINGEILTDEGFRRGQVSFEKNDVSFCVSDVVSQGSNRNFLIVPTLVNSHTHIGDCFIRDEKRFLPRDVKKLVKPPDGLKHKLLREASDDKIIEGMVKAVDVMKKNGISCFLDFRENGVKGVSLFRKALNKTTGVYPLVLSRPDQLRFNIEEIGLLLKNSDGIGISGVSDWCYSDLEKITRLTRKEKKIFALHASEVIREDIDKILDLKPSFLVHMNKATESDLLRVEQENIPVVVCPRSNAFFNIETNFKLFKKTGVKLMLGTDNCMLYPPSIIDEIKYVLHKTKMFSLEELLKMVTFMPRKVLNLKSYMWGSKLDEGYVVLEKKTLKPVFYVVKKNRC